MNGRRWDYLATLREAARRSRCHHAGLTPEESSLFGHPWTSCPLCRALSPLRMSAAVSTATCWMSDNKRRGVSLPVNLRLTICCDSSYTREMPVYKLRSFFAQLLHVPLSTRQDTQIKSASVMVGSCSRNVEPEHGTLHCQRRRSARLPHRHGGCDCIVHYA